MISAVVASAVLVCVLAIDRQSYWMDELGTWSYARAQGLQSWVITFLNIDNSDGQLPLYHFLIFAWSRLFGVEEVALRSLNGLFLLAMLLAILRSRALAMPVRIMWIGLILCNCFVWAYLNEARPYVLLMAGGAFLSLSMAWASRAAEGERAVDAAVLWFMLGAVTAFGASPVASPFVLVAAAGAFALAGTQGTSAIMRSARRQWLFIAACIAFSLLLLALVLYSMNKGATPELANKTSLASLIFSGIEVLGGGGLVPGREDLRASGLGALTPLHWLMLVAFAASAGGIIIQAMRTPQARLATVTLIVLVASIIGVGVAGTIIGFRVVGRHVAFASPLLLLVVAIGINGARTPLARALAFVLVALLFVSTLTFRLSDSHGKDQTRDAAAFMNDVRTRGGTGWWIGAPLLLDRYKIPTISLGEALHNGAPPGAVLYAAPNEEWHDVAGQLPAPDAILVERPENADRDLFFTRMAERHDLRTVHRFRGYAVFAAQ